eukprot:39301-Pyramimonas_sp.AAC.1
MPRAPVTSASRTGPLARRTLGHPKTPGWLQGWKWHGGVVGPNGAVYGIPSHADCVLKIQPIRKASEELSSNGQTPREMQAVREPPPPSHPLPSPLPLF